VIMTSPTEQTVEDYVTFFQGQLYRAEILAVIVRESPGQVFPRLLSLMAHPESPPARHPPSAAPLPEPVAPPQTDRRPCNCFSVDLHGFTREYAALYLRRVRMSWAVKNSYSWTFIHGRRPDADAESVPCAWDCVDAREE
jgi:hypothetical protein